MTLALIELIWALKLWVNIQITTSIKQKMISKARKGKDPKDCLINS